jgi:hypothetical protein
MSLQVVDDAEAEFLAYFAGKTIGMVRAPDVFVFPAPFNIIETFLIAPLECVLHTLSLTRRSLSQILPELQGICQGSYPSPALSVPRHRNLTDPTLPSSTRSCSPPYSLCR